MTATPTSLISPCEITSYKCRYAYRRDCVQCGTENAVRRIRDDIAPQVAADTAYKNAKQNTPHTARMAHDQALAKVMQLLLKDDTQVYKQFVENDSFKRFVGDMVYTMTSE